MSINIVDLVKGYVTPELISKAGSFLGESESGITKAATGAIPALLGAFTSKAAESDGNASELLDTAKGFFNSGILNNASSLFGNADILSKGTSFLNSFLGNKTGSIIDTIAGFAGLKSSSTGSMLGMLAPLLLGVLGKHSSDNNLSASGLSSLLSSQKSNILSALPSGLGSIGSLFGLGQASEAVKDVKAAAASTYNYAEEKVEKSGGMNWLLPLLLLAALALGLWYFLGKGCNKGEGTVTGGDTVASVPAMIDTAAKVIAGTLDTVTGNFVYEVGTNKEITLKDGTKLTVGENSTEAKLYNFLSDDKYVVDTVDKSKDWYVLDRVYFETGKSVLTAASQQQLKNIAAILKNYPTAQVKMGGYTDNTGDVNMNVKLSGDRAKIAAGELVKLGVATANVASEGYGPEHPVCPANDTPACKAQNRRVDIRVTKK